MDILNDYSINCRPINTDEYTLPGAFRISSQKTPSKTLDFFDDLYSYPPKFRIQWNILNNWQEDFFLSYNYRQTNNNFYFTEVLKDFFTSGESDCIEKLEYPKKYYFDGYKNKVRSNYFYTNETKRVQNLVKNVPVYVILNGLGEISLAHSTERSPTSFKNSNTIYQFCGDFDSSIEKNSKLGLFFMNKEDAEFYLKEIANIDSERTKSLGLSVHSFGLDFAYRIIREYHPDVDFRLIPDLKEVSDLLTHRNTKSSPFTFDYEQQQFRSLPQTSSKLFIKNQTNYFKGVPIYIVQVGSKPKNFWNSTFSSLNYPFRLVNNKLLTPIFQPFLNSPYHSMSANSLKVKDDRNEVQTFVFFEKAMAEKFCNTYKRSIQGYGNNTSYFNRLLTKEPVVFISNLENFFEYGEEGIKNNPQTSLEIVKMISETEVHVVPPTSSYEVLTSSISQEKESLVQKSQEFFYFKYKRIKGFLNVLLNTY